MRSWLILSVCVALAVAAPSKPVRKRYDGYQLIEIVVKTTEQKDAVESFHEDLEIDFWDDSPRMERPILILVPPHRVSSVHQILDNAGIDYKVTRANVQEHMDAEWERLDAKQDFDIDDYNRLEDIYDEMNNMAARCPAGLGIVCEVYSIGQSYEGREIMALKISKPDSGDRKAYWFEATTHAREWLATATHTWIMDYMTRAYETDDVVRGFIDKWDFYFVPVVNPDGYVYCWDVDRYWRKSRNPNAGSTCMGVDLNRNFDHQWGNSGTSTNPCSNNYLGPSPASEPEVQVVSQQADALGDTILAWTSVHTQGQLWLHPWGWQTSPGNCAFADDHDDMYDVATATGEAIEATHGTSWQWGNSCAEIYPASGITIDYVKGVSGIKYSFTPELRGPGHDPPATEIPPSCEEVWNGVVAMINRIEEKHPELV